MSFTFFGTSVGIYGAKRGNHGPYQVQVDNQQYPVGNGVATPDAFNQTLFSTNLQKGLHNHIDQWREHVCGRGLCVFAPCSSSLWTMLGVGLLWAFIKGWQLTFAGLAIAPGFATTMAVQTKLVARCVVRNKQAREDVARDYYNVCFVLIFCSSRDAHLAILPPDCHWCSWYPVYGFRQHLRGPVWGIRW